MGPGKTLYALAAAVLVLFLFTGCSKDTTIAGGTSEETNSLTTGNVGGTVGVTSPEEISISVSLYPSDFSPLDADSLVTTRQVINGRYTFTGVKEGTYNIVASSFGDLEKGIIQGVVIDEEAAASTDTLLVSEITLQKTSSVIVNFSEFTVSEYGMLYIPGTGIFTVWDETTNSHIVHLEDVPANTYSDILVLEELQGDSSNILTENLDVVEGTSFIYPVPVWQRAMKITIDSPQIEGDETLLEHFPVLVRLTGQDSLFDASEDGSDLRFAKRDSTPLAFSIERWDTSTATAHIWVLMDTVFLKQATPEIYMYSDSNADMPDNIPFKHLYGYAQVWDMTLIPEVNEIEEVSISNNEGTMRGTTPEVTGTPFGSAVVFNGIDNWVSTDEKIPSKTRFTIALWVKTTTTQGGKLIAFSDTRLELSDHMHDHMLWLDTNGIAHFGMNISGNGAGHRLLSGTTPLNDGRWHHLAGTLAAGSMRLYVDGERVTSNGDVTSEMVTNIYQGYWRMGSITKANENTGWENQPRAEFFEGIIEDVRIVSHNVDDDYLKLNWELHKPSSNLIRIE